MAAAGVNWYRRGRAIRPKSVFELHRSRDGVSAAMRIAYPAEPFDDQGRQQQQPVHQHAVGMMTAGALAAQPPARRPNVVLVLTDDRGFGDLSIHGNPLPNTPNTDAVARQGVQFPQFQASTVCSPARSSLPTGRYHYRTGIVDTFLGRSMMYPDEATLAEVLRDAGYRTGIFGKWRPGDNYPSRTSGRLDATRAGESPIRRRRGDLDARPGSGRRQESQILFRPPAGLILTPMSGRERQGSTGASWPG
jgi:hypothetical protein